MFYKTFGDAAETVLFHMQGKGPGQNRNPITGGPGWVIVPTDGGWRHLVLRNADKLPIDKRDWVLWWADLCDCPNDTSRVKTFWDGLNTLAKNGNAMAIEAKRQLDIHGLQRPDQTHGLAKGSADFVWASRTTPFLRG